MRTTSYVVTALALLASSVAPPPTAAHIVVFKTCLSETVETVSARISISSVGPMPESRGSIHGMLWWRTSSAGSTRISRCRTRRARCAPRPISAASSASFPEYPAKRSRAVTTPGAAGATRSSVEPPDHSACDSARFRFPRTRGRSERGFASVISRLQPQRTIGPT